MSTRPVVQEITVTAAAGDYDDATMLTKFGDGGKISFMGVRSAVGSGVAGAVDVLIFARQRLAEYEVNELVDPPVGDRTYIDPSVVVQEFIFAKVTGLTIAAQLEASDSVSFTEANPAYYYLPRGDWDLWIAAKGVAGDILVSVSGEASVGRHR